MVSPLAEDSVTHTVELAVHETRLLEIEYWTQSEDRYSERVVEPYALINGREGWYVAAWDLGRDAAPALPAGPDQARDGARRSASSRARA